MAQYILDGLIARWGKRFEDMQRKTETDDGPKVPLYDQLPKEFSRDQLRELIVKLDLSTPARVFISKWKRAKLIYQPDKWHQQHLLQLPYVIFAQAHLL